MKNKKYVNFPALFGRLSIEVLFAERLSKG